MGQRNKTYRKYAELCRHNKNILLDLSLTIMKYKGSSIETDIDFLFNYFDRKICIGSDHPEWDYKNILNYLNKNQKLAVIEKKVNILFKNIETFFKHKQNKIIDFSYY